MNNNNNWPFTDNNHVYGMKLSDYLVWATNRQHDTELLLPSIQRGFVWKPKQIVDLWDSLLRGMPIGSLMLSKLSEGQIAATIDPQDIKQPKTVSGKAMGLLDGQQRTLAMLIGWPFMNSTQYCLWIDLAEKGHAGSPFDIRLTTRTQPFGFQRISHSRLSRHDRREARKQYDKLYPGNKSKPDFNLFDFLDAENDQPRPWKANGDPKQFVKIKDLWKAFKETDGSKSAFLDLFKSLGTDNRLSNLHEAFKRIETLTVPLILIPEHIIKEAMPDGAPDPLVLLFERIGRNGASLSPEDLLFSMIKQQFPEAQQLVNGIHNKITVRAFMSATDYVMTAFRLAAATQSSEPSTQIADNPRPNPNDFHRYLGRLLGKEGDKNKPLRDYLAEDNNLTLAFNCLFDVLRYKSEQVQDFGLPLPMMPHLPRGLTQVLLIWIMLNPDQKIINNNRQKIISFSLFWYLSVLHEDKASKAAFKIIKEDSGKGNFPATELYDELIKSTSIEEFGLALPLMSDAELEDILQDTNALFRSHDAIFKLDDSGKQPIATLKQRELYKRFCWWRKPILLWLQRAYVDREFDIQSRNDFAGLTDEDAVPYDYDHLCPQKHWGDDWRNINTIPDETTSVIKAFRNIRGGVGNCIGNLHVLESSLNRSFGDDALGSKLKSELESKKWRHQDSLLFHCDCHEKLWETASPDDENDKKKNQVWDEERLQAFQSAVYLRAKGLYRQYYEACKHIIK
ncbi:DUF262 domain-containing protein [Nitrosomonas sp.]|uniref:DUF262 domain-containing protein n=1 Tax=Nitrosomonas sp. TaxID=42353 RepID=UPI0025E1FB50|nr:DUF262 domain-containing protein [Nitrosomonas sp.]MBV6448077.1 hypothetical protein [Nitrosomonas sp.]